MTRTTVSGDTAEAEIAVGAEPGDPDEVRRIGEQLLAEMVKRGEIEGPGG